MSEEFYQDGVVAEPAHDTEVVVAPETLPELPTPEVVEATPPAEAAPLEVVAPTTTEVTPQAEVPQEVAAGTAPLDLPSGELPKPTYKPFIVKLTRLTARKLTRIQDILAKENKTVDDIQELICTIALNWSKDDFLDVEFEDYASIFEKALSALSSKTEPVVPQP